MDQKRLLLLVGTLVVLLGAAWLSGFFAGTASTVETPDLTFSPDNIHGITIRKGEDIIVAARSADGVWRLQSPVDAAIDTMTSSALLDRLGDIQIESLVSSRTDRYEKFQVDSAQATYFLLEGRASIELYVGKTGPDFQSRYVRLGNDERVFLATGIPTAEPSLDRWRDKMLWTYPKESIVAVVVTTPESTYRLVSTDAGWTLEQDENGTLHQTDSLKVDRYLDRLATMKADGFLLDVDHNLVVDSMSFSIDIQRVDGSGSQLRIMKRETDAAGVAGESNDVVKLLSYRAARLAPEPADLLPE